MPKDICEGEPMQGYFNLISSHKTILDEEGIEVADMKEARAFARERSQKWFRTVLPRSPTGEGGR